MASSQLTSILAAQEDKILACVHCGLCLEACPTYVVTGDENDSPRGRIYLMRAVEEGRLPKTSPAFQRHIDRCLGCRACETVCPAGVQYGELLEAARSEILSAPARRGPRYSLMRFVLRHVWLQPARLRAAFGAGRMMRQSGLASLLLRTGLAKLVSPRFEFALLLLQSSTPAFAIMEANRGVSANGNEQGDANTNTGAQLFRGCVTDGLFVRVNRATERVLGVNGCAVTSPPGQVCCGALHAHAGDLEGARRLARQNIDAFDQISGPDGSSSTGGEVGQAFLPVSSSNQALADPETTPVPIITTAGGCGAMLVSYAHLLGDDESYGDRARAFSARVRDIGQQLEATGCRDGAAIGSTPVTYDGSCHLLHGQHGGDASLAMLGAVPNLKFVPLAGSDVCCGGAGVYNLLEEDLSGRVLAQKLKHIEESGASVLATGNAGCHMQIGAGAKLAGLDLRVCHPVELLDKSYGLAGFYDGSEPPAVAGG